MTLRIIVFGLLLSVQGILAAGQSGEQSEGREFAGIRFGVGLSVTRAHGVRDRIEGATVDEQGIVRVTEDKNTPARIMLESHYFFQPLRPIDECQGSAAKRSELCRKEKKKARISTDYSTYRQNWGWGPFVAIQPGTEEIIQAIGGGLMVGFKRPGSDNSSFNIGLGFVVDPSVQVLGDGFAANSPAPVDSDGNPLPVQLKKTDQGGFLLLASFSF